MRRRSIVVLAGNDRVILIGLSSLPRREIVERRATLTVGERAQRGGQAA